MPARRIAISLLALLTFVLTLGPRPTAATHPATAAGAVLDQSATGARPNILFILTDDLDAAPMAMFPRLQAAMSGEGVTFTNYFVNTSLCCPSRASTLRGQYSHNTHITGNSLPAGGFEKFYDLGLESATVATWLQAAGYHTALLGKYLNGYPDSAPEGYIPPGWDDWVSPVAGNPYSEYNYTLNDNGTLVSHGREPSDYLTDVLSERAGGIINRAAGSGQPWFMYLSVYAPHGPSTPAPRHADAFADVAPFRPPSFNEADVSDKPEWVRERPRLAPRTIQAIDQQYRRRLQSMLAVEDLVDNLIATLRQTGQLDNTYIFFASDNGFHLGQHRLATGKQTAYDEDVHVPLIVRGPGIAAASTIDDITGNIDLAPTWAELAGATVPDFVDGRSFAPRLRGAAPGVRRQAFLLEHGAVDEVDVTTAGDDSGNGMREPADLDESTDQARGGRRAIPIFQGIRTPEYSFVQYVTGEQELYDLRADPYQLTNLAATADPALIERLSGWLRGLSDCAGSACRAADSTP